MASRKENPLIEVKHLSKEYEIGMDRTYKTLSESVTNAVCHPIRTLRGLRAPNETFWALKDINFEVERGEVLGIIGRNGAGKSTLLKILSRITYPTEGEAILRGRVGSLLEVGTGFHPELTGRENIYFNGAILGMKKREIDEKFDEIVKFSGVERFLDTPVKRYSSGMQVRLAFSVAAHLEPEILLVDEVLAVGDAEFQKKCLGKMGEVASEGRTVLFVSHNMGAIERICNQGILLADGYIMNIGNIKDIINIYTNKMKTEKRLSSSAPIQDISISQKGDNLEINVRYQTKEMLQIPCLGFLISDIYDRPICASNPILDGINYIHKSKSAGSIKVILKYPKLLDGEYNLSIWFGDGKEDFYHEENIITFKVVNMVHKKQLPSFSVGPVSPICDWIFGDD